jgi:hypothetical protein
VGTAKQRMSKIKQTRSDHKATVNDCYGNLLRRWVTQLLTTARLRKDGLLEWLIISPPHERDGG